MADSARKNRRSKEDVIVLDDDEPEVKSSRKEPKPVPSSEVVELQQKLTKAEKKIERLIKIAGDAQSRVEFLESLIDKKPNIKEEPKNVEELEKSVADLTNKFEEERQKSRESLNSLTNQLEQERRQASEERAKERERIDNLGRKLAILEKERVQIDIDRKGDRQRIEELKSNIYKHVPTESFVAIVEEWKKKTCNFQSDDVLVSVVSRAFDTMSTVLKSLDQCHMQRSLESLDRERSLCLSLEKTREPSIRNLMYGVIESLHLTLCHVTGVKFQPKSSNESSDIGVENKGRSSTNKLSREKSIEYIDVSDEDDEPTVKKSRADESECTTPQCVMCDKYPKTVYSYASHLVKHHSSLKTNKIFLLCSCGVKICDTFRNSNHKEKCEGLKFTLHKIEEIHTTPKCVLCEKYPETSFSYADHLYAYHNCSLNMSGYYVLCSCGVEVRSHRRDSNHTKDGKCDGRHFTLHRQ